MANFRGTIRGARGEASRLGHSRLEGRVAGWDVGVGLCAYQDDNGVNRIGIHVDEGNGYNPGRNFSLGTVEESANGPMYYPSDYVKELVRQSDAILAAIEVNECQNSLDEAQAINRAAGLDG